MELEQAIHGRRTHKVFAPEPVAPGVLQELFELARWAPNHNLTNPWRFRVLGPRTLARLKVLAEELSPGSQGKLDRAPTLVVASVLRTGEKAQQADDLLASAVAAYLVLLAALCLGKEPDEIAASVSGSAALKSLVTVAINDFFAPIRARRAELAGDPGYLRQVLGEGNDRANQIADATLAQVRTAMGMDYAVTARSQ